MDFIEQLPLSEGYTDILVIINQMTKQATFIPTHWSIDTRGLADLFIKHIFFKHGVPSYVTSNRGLEFISRFFKSLSAALGMYLYFILGYHPEVNS